MKPSLSPRAARMLHALLDGVDADLTMRTPLPTMARRQGISRSTATRALRELEGAGVVERVPRLESGYRLLGVASALAKRGAA